MENAGSSSFVAWPRLESEGQEISASADLIYFEYAFKKFDFIEVSQL